MTLDAEGKPQEVVVALTGEETVQVESLQGSEVQPPKDSKPPKTYTEDEVERKFSQQRSVLDKRITELEKQLTKTGKALDLTTKRASEAENAYARIQKEKEDDEYEGIKDNPDAISIYQAKKRNQEREAELSKKEKELEEHKAEHEEALSELRTFKLTQEAQAIAAKYEGVDAELLIRLTDKSPEKMELLASQLGALKAKKALTPPLPDSGLSIGGQGKLTDEQIEKMSVEEYAKHPSVVSRFK